MNFECLVSNPLSRTILMAYHEAQFVIKLILVTFERASLSPTDYGWSVFQEHLLRPCIRDRSPAAASVVTGRERVAMGFRPQISAPGQVDDRDEQQPPFLPLAQADLVHLVIIHTNISV